MRRLSWLLGAALLVAVVLASLSVSEGVSVPVALSATSIFRGLSFWLPMLPGLWFSRRLTAGVGGARL